MSDLVKQLSDINESAGVAAGVAEGYLTGTLKARATYIGYGSTGIDVVLRSLDEDGLTSRYVAAVSTGVVVGRGIGAVLGLTAMNPATVAIGSTLGGVFAQKLIDNWKNPILPAEMMRAQQVTITYQSAKGSVFETTQLLGKALGGNDIITTKQIVYSPSGRLVSSQNFRTEVDNGRDELDRMRRLGQAPTYRQSEIASMNNLRDYQSRQAAASKPRPPSEGAQQAQRDAAASRPRPVSEGAQQAQKDACNNSYSRPAWGKDSPSERLASSRPAPSNSCTKPSAMGNKPTSSSNPSARDISRPAARSRAPARREIAFYWACRSIYTYKAIQNEFRAA